MLHPEIKRLWDFLQSHDVARSYAATVLLAGVVVGMLVGGLVTALLVK